MALTTLKDLRQRVTDRLDEGASTYHIPNMLNVYLNEAMADVWNMVALEDPWRLARTYYCKPLNTIGLPHYEREFALPEDFARLLDCTRPVERLFANKVRVKVTGDVLRPLGLNQPAGAVTPDMLRIEFVPQFAEILNDAQLIKLPVIPGHDRWIVQQAVILGKLKEETSTLQMQDENDRLWQRMLVDVRHRSRVRRTPSLMQITSYSGWPAGRHDPLVGP